MESFAKGALFHEVDNSDAGELLQSHVNSDK